MTYNNATKNSEGIIVDKIIEADFNRNRKIIILFESPIILT